MLAQALFLIPVLAAAISDLLTRRIPNWLTGGLALFYLPVAMLDWPGLTELGLHAATGALLLAAGFGLQVYRLIGGWDVKLLAAVGLWLGWHQLATLLVSIALVGGGLSLFMLTMEMLASHFAVPLERKGVPYGVAIAAGAIISLHPVLTII